MNTMNTLKLNGLAVALRVALFDDLAVTHDQNAPAKLTSQRDVVRDG